MDNFLLISEKEESSSQFDEDLDLALALSLQDESNDVIKSVCNKIVPSSSKPLGLTDPQWEFIDPNPDIHSLFLEFNSQFFWGKLSSVEVRWSPQMTLCAGVCCYEGRGGLCSVRLSLPLLKLRPRSDLVETLLHEMIHAYLFVTANNRDHDGHGPQFLSHMNRINKDAGTKISVYHSFHDEVDYQRKHWWKCDGPCSQRRPFFGIVKRAKNRAPGPNDRWWSQHQSSCGGKFIKIVEPENYKQKNLKRKQNEENKNGKSSANIKNFFQPSTSSDSTSASAKKKKDNTEVKAKSIFSEEDSLVSLEENNFKLPLPSKSLDSIPKIPSPFSGPGRVLGSSETPTSLLSKIRKELGYTPLKGTGENSKGKVKPNLTTNKEKLPKEDENLCKKQINEEKVLKNHGKNEKLLKKDTKSGTTNNIPIIKPIKKEKLPKGNSKKLPVPVQKSPLSDARENKLKQGSLDKYVSSPKGSEMLNVSQNLVDNLTMVMCPVCCNSFRNSEINTHLDQCLNG